MNELLQMKAELERQLKVVNDALELLKKGKVGLDLNGKAIATEDIEEAILEIKGDFSTRDVSKCVEEKFPGKALPNNYAIATSLYKLVADHKLEYVRVRAGRRPAIYRVSHKR